MTTQIGFTLSPTQYKSLYNPKWLQSMTRLTDQFTNVPTKYITPYVKQNFPETLFNRNDWALVTIDCMLDRLAKLSSNQSRLRISVVDLTKKVGRGPQTYDRVFQVLNGVGVKETHWSGGKLNVHIQKFYNLILKRSELTIKNIQNEIYERGSVQSIIETNATLVNHADNSTYCGGPKSNTYAAIRIVGWSTTDEHNKYWICAPLYGQKRTTLWKVRMGQNVGGIECWAWGTNGYTLLEN